MAKVVWAERAIDDVTDIAEYREKYSAQLTSSIVSKIFKKVEILKKFPLSGRVVPEINNNQIRELIDGNYRIIYEYNIIDNRIEILMVHHSSRPLPLI